jgi:hypothetical protein
VDSLVNGAEVWRWWIGVADDGGPAWKEGGRRPTVDSLVGDMEAQTWWTGAVADNGPARREGRR